LKTENKYRVIL